MWGKNGEIAMGLPRCFFLNCKYNLQTYCKDVKKFEDCEYQRLLRYESESQVQNMLQVMDFRTYRKCPLCGGKFK